MQDPDKEKCKVCQKLLKKTSMKKHHANVHGKAAQEKKLAKKQAAKSSTVINSNVNQKDSYAVPADVDDAKMAELQRQLEDFVFMEIDPAESYDATPVKRNQEEQKVQKKLEKKTGYTHMRCPAGIIDLFSAKDGIIIEIKSWKSWKHAIGQLLAYHWFYPKYMLRAHYFGSIPPDEIKIMILSICHNLRIHVTWEE